MRRRFIRALALAGALGCLCATGASGQARAQGEPVVGGGSFNAAPVLEPGSYRDTIRPSEALYYAVELAPGESFSVGARLEERDELATVQVFGVDFWNILRQDDPSAGDFAVYPGRMAVRGEYGPAVPTEQAIASSASFAAPGVWYFSLLLSDAEENRGRQFPVRFELERAGAIVEEPAPDLEQQTTTGSTAENTTEGEGESGSSIAAGAVGLAAGLALGGAAGLLSRRRQRGNEGGAAP